MYTDICPWKINLFLRSEQFSKGHAKLEENCALVYEQNVNMTLVEFKVWNVCISFLFISSPLGQHQGLTFPSPFPLFA